MSEYEDVQTCPGCERQIADYHSVCPHCKYDIDNGKPVEVKLKPKELKKTKIKEKIKPKQRRGAAGRSLIYVPALGRLGRPSIDFPALHWPKGQEPTDDNLIEWAESLRCAWSDEEPHGAGDSMGWLSNHAIGCLASNADSNNNHYDDKVLRQNYQKIVNLIGGDDWK